MPTSSLLNDETKQADSIEIVAENIHHHPEDENKKSDEKLAVGGDSGPLSWDHKWKKKKNNLSIARLLRLTEPCRDAVGRRSSTRSSRRSNGSNSSSSSSPLVLISSAIRSCASLKKSPLNDAGAKTDEFFDSNNDTVLETQLTSCNDNAFPLPPKQHESITNAASNNYDNTLDLGYPNTYQGSSYFLVGIFFVVLC